MMKKGWSAIPLGDLLVRSDEMIEIVPTETYKEVTVRLWGKGIALRQEIAGQQIASERRFRVRTGQFILSRIDARNGAFGIIPDELDGAVVSNDFPTYNAVPNKLLSPFLGWLSRTRKFWDLCKRASEGTTNRVRLQEDKFLSTSISTPPLVEQRRIVAKIEELAKRIDEARGICHRLKAESDFLLRSSLRDALASHQDHATVALEEVCAEIIDCLHSNPIYSDGGVPTLRSPDIGWGDLFLDSARRTSEHEYQRRTQRGQPKQGDIILVREGGGTGKAGIVENGQRFSLGQRVMMLRPDLNKVIPRFLLYQWLSPLILDDQINARMKGSASPHLNIKALRRFDFILPPLAVQRQIVGWIDSVRSRLIDVQQHRRRTLAELDALLPSILDRAFCGKL